MQDLISRADVEQTVEDDILCYTHSDRPIDQDPDTECDMAIRMALRMLRKDLRKLPSAQPERKKGKWIGYNTEQDGWKRTDGSPVFMSCSECNGLVLNNGSAHWNFCPNCGAKMDEEG